MLVLDNIVEKGGDGRMVVEGVQLDESGKSGDVDMGLQAVMLHVVGERGGDGIDLERARKVALDMVMETLLGLVARVLVGGMMG